MHYLDPQLQKAHIILCYRNFLAKKPHFCHVGLGVNALHTVRVLRAHQIHADAHGVWTSQDVEDVVAKDPSVTHCLIEAPWVSTVDMQRLLLRFPNVHFMMRTHSEVGFLQVEPGAITLLRDQILLSEQMPNFTVAANSHRLTSFLRLTYTANVLYLPNLYDITRTVRKRAEPHRHKLLRIGSFGALRWLKNHTTAAAAALTIAKERNCDVELWMSVDREEHGNTVLQSVRNMFSGLPWATLREAPWQTWAMFRRTLASMDLSLQPSFTETFNIVTADAVSEGVPAVVSHSVEWAPDAWKASPDAIDEMVHIGLTLLHSPRGAEDGLHALENYGTHALAIWKAYLSSNPAGPVNRLA